jgi:hypothetical protein
MENRQGVIIWPRDGSRLVVVLLVLLVVYDGAVGEGGSNDSGC